MAQITNTTDKHDNNILYNLNLFCINKSREIIKTNPIKIWNYIGYADWEHGRYYVNNILYNLNLFCVPKFWSQAGP